MTSREVCTGLVLDELKRAFLLLSKIEKQVVHRNKYATMEKHI